MFGQRLKLARLTNKLTLEELANIYNSKFTGGLNKGTLSRYENEKQEPKVNVVKNLAAILGVSPDYLLNGKDGGERSAYRAKLENEFVSLIERAGEEDLEKIELAIRLLKTSNEDFEKIKALINIAVPKI
ncbi:MAG: helix-turn-helix transcriptional regulator [Clostridia bacterium]|nr:helix-turn-helix transcriptional regulator [Clostridia bacterium]